MEDFAWVVEYLPLGHAAASKKESIVQLLGERFFTLLEASIKPDASIVIGQKVCVGREGRKEVEHIKGRIKYEDLTGGAKEFLPNIVKKAVTERQADFIGFLNKAKPISIRVHTLDLLPGIGKKTMEAILTEREKEPFTDFDDLKKRVSSLSDPVGIFSLRILNELEGKEKYYLFTKPPFERRERDYRR
jgi:putative nucleotide binding protein